MIDRIVDGRFRLEAEAGRGGMGIVYRALDERSGELVALKLLRNQGAAARFNREARALAQTNHPGVVRHIAHGTTSAGEPYLAMEWLDGEDLAARLLRAGPLGIDGSMELARHVATALAVLHRAGVVHRDLKPRNLFLVGGRVSAVKILDFGLALFSDSTASDGAAVLGTPAYMAPEQARGVRDIDARADVYALGCVLFECLTGRPAFVADHPWAVLAKVLFEEAPPARVHGDVPADAADLVARMLAKEPAARPRDGSEVAALLDVLDRAAPRPDAATSLTAKERRLVSVIVTDVEGAADTMPVVIGEPTAIYDLDDLRAAAARAGARLERLANGQLVASLAGTGAATDLAGDSARLALVLHRLLAGHTMVLVTGLGVEGERWPIGDAIDRAAQLLRQARPGSLRVDPTTAALLDPRYEVTDELELTGERPEAGARMLLGRPAPFVGRDREIHLIEGVFRECANEGSARAVVVTAPAGVGKSRLRHELFRRLGVEPWIARADVTGSSPLALAAQIVRDAAGLRAGEAVADQHAKIIARTAAVGDADRHRAAVFLAALVGAPFANDPAWLAAHQDPMLMGDQLRRAFVDWLAAETAKHPITIVLEDVHRGDLASVRLVDDVLGTLADRPIFVLALARPEVRERFPDLWSTRALVGIELSPLSRRAAERMVGAVLGAGSGEMAARIVEVAGGNAFFLEELIRGAAEQQDALPTTIVAMMHTRLAALPDGVRRTLRAASIFGETFWRGGVRALTGSDGALAELQARELVVPRRDSRLAGDEELAFRHALVRQAAYESLTDDDRAVGHRLAASWLEEAGEQDATVLAEHFERGDEAHRAIGWYLRAAQAALDANDFQAAIARARRGAECGAEGVELGEMLLVEAQANDWLGELAAAGEAGGRAMAHLPTDSPSCYRAIRAALWDITQDHDEIVAMLLSSIRTPPANDAVREAQISALLQAGQHARQRGGDFAPFFVVVEERTRALESPSDRIIAELEWSNGMHRSLDGEPDRARGAFERARARYQRIGDTRMVSLTLANLGFIEIELGLYDEAIARLSVLLATTVERAHVLQNLGAARLHLGCFEEARSFLEEAIERHRGDPRMLAESHGYLARVELGVGNLDRAEELARRALHITGTGFERPVLQAILAEILLAAGRRDEALHAAIEAKELLDAHGGTSDEYEGLLRLVHVEALLAVGRSDEARVALVAARDRLLARAAKVGDDRLRASFLGVPEHARTLALAQKMQA